MITPSVFQILLFFCLWPLVWAPIGFLLSYSLGWNPLRPLSPLQKLPFVLSLYAIALPLLAMCISWSNLSWAAVGISASNLLSSSFLIGLIISVISIFGLFSLFWGLGWITQNNRQRSLPYTDEIKEKGKVVKTTARSAISDSESTLPSATMLIPSFLLLGMIVGGVEELVFRGFLTGRLYELWPVWLAGAIASLLFALLHLVWEGSDNLPQLPGLWVMGMVLTLAWWIDNQSIALAWGLHTGWIWSVATIDTLELIDYTQAVPTWVTGIDNRPLAGVMGIGALTLTGLGISLFG